MSCWLQTFPSWDIVINEKNLHAVWVNCSLLYKVFVISIRKSKCNLLESIKHDLEHFPLCDQIEYYHSIGSNVK